LQGLEPNGCWCERWNDEIKGIFVMVHAISDDAGILEQDKWCEGVLPSNRKNTFRKRVGIVLEGDCVEARVLTEDSSQSAGGSLGMEDGEPSLLHDRNAAAKVFSNIEDASHNLFPDPK
jgi:hypothetical protein